MDEDGTPPGVRKSVADSRALEAIASEIKSAWEQARRDQIAALEGYVRVGRLLSEARDGLASNNAYGEWFRAQQFGFSTEWGRRLRSLADNEGAVRQLAAEALSRDGKPASVSRLLDLLAGGGAPHARTHRTIRIPADIDAAGVRLEELGRQIERLEAVQAAWEAYIAAVRALGGADA